MEISVMLTCHRMTSLGDFYKAIGYHEKHLKIAIAIGEREGEGGVYGNLGNDYDSPRDYRKAMEYHDKDLKMITIKIGDLAGKGKAHGNLETAYRSLGFFRKAIGYHEKDFKIATEMGDRAGGEAHGKLGIYCNFNHLTGCHARHFAYRQRYLFYLFLTFSPLRITNILNSGNSMKLNKTNH